MKPNNAQTRDVSRDISYASSAQTRLGKVMIRTVENATGRPHLIRRADGYQNDVDAGRSFWDVVVRRYGLSLDVVRGQLDAIPREGPLVVVANHPFGILDGLLMGYLLDQRRAGEFRILANHVFRKAQALDEVILPVRFDETRDAMKTNLETRKEAQSFLKNGGAIGIFPGGTVSTSETLFSRPMDPSWRNFTAKMIMKSKATVVPVCFEGHNSRLFQIASHLHPNLRLALLIREFRKKVDTPAKISIGAAVDRDILNEFGRDARAMMDFLRAKTYELSKEDLEPHSLGFEFEEKYKKNGSRNI
ncbi:MAG: lysophospholipid acyltransferase family protein [Halocynthiibacter sp.]